MRENRKSGSVAGAPLRQIVIAHRGLSMTTTTAKGFATPATEHELRCSKNKWLCNIARLFRDQPEPCLIE
jgi:hypothetical protein